MVFSPPPPFAQAGATYFVTFRLVDSIPQRRLDEITRFRERWYRLNPPPRSDRQWSDLWKETFLMADKTLDECRGACLRATPYSKRRVTDALHFFDGERYELGAYVVMPNHVHSIVRPYDLDDLALARILHSWKRHSAVKINQELGREGSLWQDECYDRLVRDESHLWNTLQYIGRNAEAAGLDIGECPTWVSPIWDSYGWTFVQP